MKIGVFALQGAFIEHERTLARLGVECKEVRKRSDFTDGLDGIILPGGESTTQGKLFHEEGLFEPVKEAIFGGLPVFGTCAGMILLAKKLSNDQNVYFGALNVTVKRNAYGRQLGSFETQLDFQGIGKIPAVFIRGPYVEAVGEGVDVLATVDGNVVAVRQKQLLATSFHPEVTSDLKVHSYFTDIIRGKI